MNTLAFENNRSRLPLRVATVFLGAGALFGVAGCSSSSAEPTQCYDGTLAYGSVEGAIIQTAEVAKGIDNLDGYSGVHASGITINDELVQQHVQHNKAAIAQTGDNFSICITDKTITINPYKAPVAHEY